MDIRIAALVIAAVAAFAPAPAPAAVDCQVESLLRAATSLDRENAVQGSEWVNVARADAAGTPGAARSVSKDGTVVSLRLTRPSNSLVTKTPFVFKSSWPLNPKFAFNAGDTLLVRGTLDAPNGEPLYVLQGDGPFGNRIMFARMDGQLCSKVINPGRPANFLPKEFSASDPAARLEPDTSFAENPITVKIVYLGASGGTAKYREIWSVDGRVVDDTTHDIDADATEFELANLRLTQAKPGATSVTISTSAVPERIRLTERIWSHLRNLN